MLSCEQFEILLADHLDGELAPPERASDRAAFEAHRASCRMCAELAEDAGSAVAFMEIAADVEPSGADDQNPAFHQCGLGIEAAGAGNSGLD